MGALKTPERPSRARSGESPALTVSPAEARVLDAMADAVIVTDLSGRIVFWSRHAASLYGWSAIEVIGRNVLEVTPADDAHVGAADTMARIVAGESWTGEFRVQRRDGTTFVASVTVVPLCDEARRVVGVVGTSRDVTSERHAERLTKQLADVGRIIGGSLNAHDMLERIARTLVPECADACSIVVLGEPGTLDRAVGASVDPDVERSLCELGGTEGAGGLESVGALDFPGWLAWVREKLTRDERSAEVLSRVDDRGGVVVPLSARGRALGVLSVGVLRRSGRGLVEADARFIEEIAHRLALALDNLRAHDRAEREQRIYETLYRLGTSFTTELDEEKLIQLVTDEATALTGAHIGSFFFNAKDERGDAYMLYALSGATRETFAGFSMPRATPMFSPTFRGEGIIRLDDVRKDPRYEQWGPLPQGHPLVVSYLAVPVITRAGDVLGGLFFGHPEPGRFTEAHERILAGIAGQAAITLENARLYTRIRKSEAEAKAAADRARDADQRKDEFLAMLGHELRNPLAPIVTALQLLKMRGKESRETELMDRQVRHLVRLVDDLLDVARLTRGKMDLHRYPVEISEVVADAIEMASPLIEQRAHRLAVTVPHAGLVVDGDRTRLAQVVSNLLTNAARYTDPRGNIDVSASLDDGHVVLTVKDDGIGIRPDVLPGLFDMFVQSPRAIDRAEGGLGLGLTLVKILVETHGGRVDASSDGIGKGSKFVVRLPAATSQACHDTDEHPTPSRVARARGVKVLVVDDNADAVYALGNALELLGYQVETAPDGPEALKVAARFQPDVAVLDIGLPLMDGYQLAHALRERGFGELPLIAVTGYGQLEDRTRAIAEGFKAHLVKPIELEALEQAIRDVGPP